MASVSGGPFCHKTNPLHQHFTYTHTKHLNWTFGLVAEGGKLVLGFSGTDGDRELGLDGKFPTDTDTPRSAATATFLAFGSFFALFAPQLSPSRSRLTSNLQLHCNVSPYPVYFPAATPTHPSNSTFSPSPSPTHTHPRSEHHNPESLLEYCQY